MQIDGSCELGRVSRCRKAERYPKPLTLLPSFLNSAGILEEQASSRQRLVNKCRFDAAYRDLGLVPRAQLNAPALTPRAA